MPKLSMLIRDLLERQCRFSTCFQFLEHIILNPSKGKGVD
jgi:hypothetical protein